MSNKKGQGISTWNQALCHPTGSLWVYRHREQSGGYPNLVSPLLVFVCSHFLVSLNGLVTSTQKKGLIWWTPQPTSWSTPFFSTSIVICTTLMKCDNVSTGSFFGCDSPTVWAVRCGSYQTCAQPKGRTPFLRDCSDRRSEDRCFDCWFGQRVTSLHFFMSRLIHLWYVMQLTTTMASSFQSFYISKKKMGLEPWKCHGAISSMWNHHLKVMVLPAFIPWIN